MIATTRCPRHQACSRRWNDRFLQLLPAIQEQAKFAFRRAPADAQEELVQETIATAYNLFLNLCRQGKTSLAYATPLAKFAIRHVREGRRIGSRSNSLDITSPCTCAAKTITIERLDRFNCRRGEWREVLIEDRTAGPAETAAARSIGRLGCDRCLGASGPLPAHWRAAKQREWQHESSGSARPGSASCGTGSKRTGSSSTARLQKSSRASKRHAVVDRPFDPVTGRLQVRHRVIWQFSDRTIERHRRAQGHLPSERLLAGLQKGAKFSSRETYPRSVNLSVLDRVPKMLPVPALIATGCNDSSPGGICTHWKSPPFTVHSSLTFRHFVLQTSDSRVAPAVANCS